MATAGEGIVEAITWYAAGRHSEMPESIATMVPAERERLWRAAERLFARGEEYAWGVAEGIAARVRQHAG